MAFRLISRPDPAPMEFLVANATALTFGQCVSFNASGRLQPAGATGVIAGVTTHAVTAGTDQRCRIILATPDQIWEAPYVGTPAGGFVSGVNAVALDATSAAVNSAVVTGGQIAVLRFTPATTTALVQIRGRQLA